MSEERPTEIRCPSCQNFVLSVSGDSLEVEVNCKRRGCKTVLIVSKKHGSLVVKKRERIINLSQA